MGKLTFLILIIFLCFSCNRQIKDESRIREFENHMGVEMTKSINLVVNLLDSIVISNSDITDIDSAYHLFLTRLGNNQIKWDELSIDSRQRFKVQHHVKSSGLYDELFLRLKDAYIENDEIISLYEYLPKGSSRAVLSIEEITLIPKDKLKNIDSILAECKLERRVNISNRYIQALKLVMNNDSVIMNYVDAKEVISQLSPSEMAIGILSVHSDYSDYFVKRILAIEILL